ncbi:hypothetical protein [Streptomyces avicenniae]|uniref:hypothetical protein n=1 Tax=Streptomyces avicenniae TaxID=500153 RepID=UPI0006996BE3|nr:hypothetical protein [Streptomyces avicenniae]
MTRFVYTEPGRNPLRRGVALDDAYLYAGGRVPLGHLNLAAMADAFLRGQWLGGGGGVRPLDLPGAPPGNVPVTLVSGATRPLYPKDPREFAQRLGELAVHHSGGPHGVAAQAARAAAEGVPLWLARRVAASPAGPVTVTLDRALARADVWADGLPAARLRGPAGRPAERAGLAAGLALSLGTALASLVPARARDGGGQVTVASAHGRWTLRHVDRRSSAVLRDGRPVAALTRPPRRSAARGSRPLLRPLVAVRHAGGAEPLDAVVAHLLAAVCGVGDATGSIRLGSHTSLLGMPGGWVASWFTDVATGKDGDGLGPVRGTPRHRRRSGIYRDVFRELEPGSFVEWMVP